MFFQRPNLHLHRYPENTLISFQAALEAGADGLEGDLHLTSDGVIVMMHVRAVAL